jgi:hypothetical protein
VAQRLEAADGHAELLARVHVFAVMATVLSITPTASAQLAAMPMSMACSSAARPSVVMSAGRRVHELQVSGARAVLGAVAARRDAAGRAFDQEQGDRAVHGAPAR